MNRVYYLLLCASSLWMVGGKCEPYTVIESDKFAFLHQVGFLVQVPVICSTPSTYLLRYPRHSMLTDRVFKRTRLEFDRTSTNRNDNNITFDCCFCDIGVHNIFTLIGCNSNIHIRLYQQRTYQPKSEYRIRQ